MAQGVFEGRHLSAIALDMKLSVNTITEYWKRARHANGLADKAALIHRVYGIVIEGMKGEKGKRQE